LYFKTLEDFRPCGSKGVIVLSRVLEEKGFNRQKDPIMRL